MCASKRTSVSLSRDPRLNSIQARSPSWVSSHQVSMLLSAVVLAQLKEDKVVVHSEA